jgi:hypothetical protein
MNGNPPFYVVSIRTETKGLPLVDDLDTFIGLAAAYRAGSRNGHTRFTAVIPWYANIAFVKPTCGDPPVWLLVSIAGLWRLVITKISAVCPEGVRDLHVAQRAV